MICMHGVTSHQELQARGLGVGFFFKVFDESERDEGESESDADESEESERESDESESDESESDESGER